MIIFCMYPLNLNFYSFLHVTLLYNSTHSMYVCMYVYRTRLDTLLLALWVDKPWLFGFKGIRPPSTVAASTAPRTRSTTRKAAIITTTATSKAPSTSYSATVALSLLYVQSEKPFFIYLIMFFECMHH